MTEQKTLEVPQLQCSDKVVDLPVEFIEGYGRPFGPAATSGLVEGASDSVHRQSQWTFQFLRDGYAFSVGMAAMRGWPFFALLQLSGVERQFSEPSMVKSSLPSRAPAQFHSQR